MGKCKTCGLPTKGLEGLPGQCYVCAIGDLLAQNVELTNANKDLRTEIRRMKAPHVRDYIGLPVTVDGKAEDDERTPVRGNEAL